MANDVKWIIYSSGQYMLVRFNVGNEGHSSTGFLAKIHYGKDIQKNTSVELKSPHLERSHDLN